MKPATQTPPAGFVAYSPVRPAKSYSELVATYGEAAFRQACADAKNSPLSVQEILELRAARPDLFKK